MTHLRTFQLHYRPTYCPIMQPTLVSSLGEHSKLPGGVSADKRFGALNQKQAALMATFMNFPRKQSSFLLRNKHDTICTALCNADTNAMYTFTLTLFNNEENVSIATSTTSRSTWDGKEGKIPFVDSDTYGRTVLSCMMICLTSARGGLLIFPLL